MVCSIILYVMFVLFLQKSAPSFHCEITRVPVSFLRKVRACANQRLTLVYLCCSGEAFVGRSLQCCKKELAKMGDSSNEKKSVGEKCSDGCSNFYDFLYHKDPNTEVVTVMGRTGTSWGMCNLRTHKVCVFVRLFVFVSPIFIRSAILLHCIFRKFSGPVF